jgi:hypothetical protein
MSKYKKKYKKYKLSGKCKDSKLKQMKTNIQKEQRTAYWQYIEKMICNIPASTLRIHNVAVWLLFGQVPFLRVQTTVSQRLAYNVF